MTSSKLSALIDLLDDPDYEVYNVVTQQLMDRGEGIIHELEEAWEKSSNEVIQHRIEGILQNIQLNTANKGLKDWIDGGADNILEGAYWVAKHQYPDLMYSQLERSVDKIKTNIWLEINDGLTALEKIRIVNHFIFDIHKFTEEHDFKQTAYCFINHVLDTKRGNPTTLTILYIYICQQLEMPVYGVCLPRNFLVTYYDHVKQEPLFYINPFFKGTPLSKNDIDAYFKQVKVEPMDEYYQPRSNKTSILRLIEILIYVYELEENTFKADVYKKLIPLFGGEQTYFQHDEP